MFKPHYAPDEHCLWADLAYTTSPLRQYTGFLMSAGVVMALGMAEATASAETMAANTAGFYTFLSGAQSKFDAKAKAHDMFVKPGLIH